MNTDYGGGRLRSVRENAYIESANGSIAMPGRCDQPATASEVLPAPRPARVSWSLKVSARDAFTLCRVLTTCEEVDITCCTPVVKQGEARIRVDVTLPENRIDRALHEVMQQVNSAEFGRIEK